METAPPPCWAGPHRFPLTEPVPLSSFPSECSECFLGCPVQGFGGSPPAQDVLGFCQSEIRCCAWVAVMIVACLSVEGPGKTMCPWHLYNGKWRRKEPNSEPANPFTQDPALSNLSLFYAGLRPGSPFPSAPRINSSPVTAELWLLD